ncbi:MULTISPECIES: HlyU family transcriptional regulator [Roseobacteraceae]|uniref:HlyU family transcriptional regulator n=1 Tax=Roseobacteraceae TaxID=2854170 RepID=UPI002B27AA87|nr:MULTISPECIES: HlyU family transcriptional regulator [Roseobacteraceae]
MSFFKKLFGGGSASGTDKDDAQPEEYKGFLIHPQPVKQPGGYRIGARIEKDVDGTARSHDLIRADIISDPEEAERMSLLKAKQVIDEQGERLFG